MKQRIKLIMSDGKIEIYYDIKHFSYFENTGNLFFEKLDGHLIGFKQSEINSFTLESYTVEVEK